jgi:hypothetical protein
VVGAAVGALLVVAAGGGVDAATSSVSSSPQALRAIVAVTPIRAVRTSNFGTAIGNDSSGIGFSEA